MASSIESHAWWAALRHEGLLLDESRLRVLFPDAPRPLNTWRADHLRKALVTFQATPEDTATRTALITHLLEETIGLSQSCGGTWQRGSAVAANLAHRSVTGENIKPQHLWTHEGSPPLPVFISPDTRLGVGHGKRTAARVIEWMRARQTRLALLTNGHQWRILYAHGDSSAWCESDSTQWFLEGQPAPQLDALRLLLNPRVLLAETPDPAKPTSPLLTAIEASRRGQSELSAILGERVRLAVEKLIASHGPAFLAQADAPARQDIYVAACRIVLRLVFTLFAEARDLLPRSNPVYWHSYSLGGLLEQLLRAGAGSARERLRHRFSAWPRLIALGRLVHAGSPHEAMPLLPYGGELFAPGDATSTDGISRALAIFESACFDSDHQIMPDSEVLEVLTLITRTQAVIRQGRGRTTVTVPVDFSDLSSEYIGILYEGLLDYELRCVSDDEAAVLFLAVGHEPALPLARLEQMKDEDLKGLVDAFKKAAKAPAGEGEEESEEEDPTEDEPGLEDSSDPSDSPDPSDPSDLPVEDETPPTNPPPASHSSEAARARALTWAKRAVVEGGLVPKPKKAKKNAPATDDYEQRLTSTARRFISRLILPGEWYLVRWGGTRKGSGSFYTRPGLATPTIRRTLEPLAYERTEGGALIPRSPQAILALKTCDPSCGSGTFPVGILRYLTEALFQSVFHHGWLVFGEDRQTDGTTRLVIKPGPAATTQPVPAVLESLLKEVRLRAIDDESRLRAWLKRLVVENCLYGVDLDPLAIELARLALWVETMDPSLPFTFLDHKFRCGNGLVGAWLDTFQHYPVMAWHREGGDKNHTNFHHHFREKSGKKGTTKVGDVWTEAIKTRLDNVIRPSLRSYIEESTEPVFALLAAIYEPNHLLDQALAAFADIHTHVDDPAAQRTAFQQWLASPHYRNLRTSLDLWCALWFWPADRLAAAPTPQNFGQPTDEALAIVEELHRTHRFFHWELEFPDVFGSGTREIPGGFHALLGNPPWEIQKPNSQEWFSNVDPLYRALGKVDALRRQMVLFCDDSQVETNWLAYNAKLKALGNFTKHAALPFGDPEQHDNKAFHFTIVSGRQNTALHARWRPKRHSLACFADPAHPFRLQGSADINTYKLFTEQALGLLRQHGRLGFILHAGIYSDQGSTTLRGFMLDCCSWEWCFGFENRKGIFSIHRSFKFAAILVQKGGAASAVKTAFMRQHVDDWGDAETVALEYPRQLITRLSPATLSLVEVLDRRGVSVLEKMYSTGVLLGSKYGVGWKVHMHREFHMTDDAKLFPESKAWRDLGYLPDSYGHWIKGAWRLCPSSAETTLNDGSILHSQDRHQEIPIATIQDIAVPLYEGVMTWQFDPVYQAYELDGSGNIGWREAKLQSEGLNTPKAQRLISFKNAIRPLDDLECHCIVFRAIQNASNRRTFIASLSPGYPTGNSLSLIEGLSLSESLMFLVSACSFLLDWVLRPRMSQANLNYFILEELPFLPSSVFDREVQKFVIRSAASLTMCAPQFAKAWLKLRDDGVLDASRSISIQLAVTQNERMRLRCILDALVARHFNLTATEFAYVVENCDFPVEFISDRKNAASLPPKGFWRVDKGKDPELRHTVLAQVAYADLCAQGLDAFLTGPDGDGWQLPETLRLADYGLGHDTRAQEPQPVASRLGPRFLDWQLQKDPAQSWAECEAHAAQLNALWSHARTLTGITRDAPEDDVSIVADTPATNKARPGRRVASDSSQPELF